MLTIDIFRNNTIFKDLLPCNKIFEKVISKLCFKNGEKYYFKSTPTSELCYWFDIDKIEKVPLPLHYPKIIPLNYDKKFCIKETRPNYVTCFLVNLLYQNRKSVMIEDCCCGQGKLAVMLSRLGFSNFSLIEDFSQIPAELLETTHQLAGTTYKLNEPVDTVKAVVFNQVAYPGNVRETSAELELYCHYKVINWFAKPNFRPLCDDSDNMMLIHCREDKYEEFTEKLRPYAVA